MYLKLWIIIQLVNENDSYLTIGMPVLKIVFGGYSQLSLLSIPLLIYHPLQILFGGLLVPVVQKWLSKRQETDQLSSV